MMTTPPDDLIGKTLGQFEILDEIGRGGMATVYRARQRSINRMVAVKVLPRSLLHDPGFYERFTREVDVIAHLEHPHILPIYDYGEAEGLPYIAMRFLAGGSMAQMIRRGLPPMEALARPISQIGQALDYAHQQGIIHRDLKPGNILLDERGNAYLTDFGIARVLNSNLTGSAIIGTPAYMSPEQANGFPLDARSDVYALGIVLFELLTGREPYEAETPVALLLKHINEPMPSVKLFRADVPSTVEHIIYRATAKSPDHRFPSAGDLAQAFSDAIQQPASRVNMQPPVSDDHPTLVEGGQQGRMTPPRVTPPSMNAPNAPSTAAGYPPGYQTGYQPGYQTGAQPGVQSGYATGHVTGTPPAYAGAEQPTSLEARPAGAGKRGLPVALLAAVAVVAIIVIGGALVLLNRPPDVVVTPTPGVAALPTPFANARLARNDAYTLSVPDSWQFTDLTQDGQPLTHVWQHGPNAYISLTLIPAQGSDFETQTAAYVDSHYASDAFSFIDEATAPDGSVRRSYRLSGEAQSSVPSGQTDTFFLNRAPYVVVLEMYTADELGSDLVPIYQQVLDSLRIAPPAEQS